MLVVPCPTFCMICYPVSPIRHAKTTTNKTIRLWTVWHTLPPRTTPKFYEFKKEKDTPIVSCPPFPHHKVFLLTRESCLGKRDGLVSINSEKAPMQQDQ